MLIDDGVVEYLKGENGMDNASPISSFLVRGWIFMTSSTNFMHISHFYDYETISS